MTSSAAFKIGIVGFGRIVELIHLPLIKQLPQIEVGGVYDVTPQRAALAAKRGFNVYSELEDLLDADVDAILVATPQNSHLPIAQAAMRYGKHVLIEKPVTLTADEAVRLKQTAAQEQKIVTVFHNRRFDSDFRTVQQFLAEGRLGSVLFVERRHHMFGSGASFGVKSFHQEWRNEKQYGGGALLDWGVHIADQLMQLRLGQCTHVRATMKSLWPGHTEVDDYVHADIVTDRNVLLTMTINFGSAAADPLWVIGGDKGTLQVTSNTEAVLFEGGKPSETFALEPSLVSGAAVIYASFADAIRTGGTPAVTLDEAIESMTLLDRIRASAQEVEVQNGHFVLGPAI